jgi:anthranilate phosphoribosyltransferase
MSIATEIDQLLAGEDLGRERAQTALSLIMSGTIDPIQVGAFLIALRAKGESAGEIAGLAAAIRAHATPVSVPGVQLVDTCGTGGGAPTFNVSTAAAFVAAGAGASVAKHGNRSATSRSGSADVLEALGARIDLAPNAIATCIERTGVGFMFAPNHHPAFKHIVPVRRALAVRSVFNLLGPLANPAGVRKQVIGIADRTYLDRIAGAVAELGADRVFVVSADDGMDEFSTAVPSEIAEVTPDGVKRWRFDPSDLGLRPPVDGDLYGGEPEDNARMIRAVLLGQEGARADIVMLNAAGALRAAGIVESMADGLDAAREAISTGRAAERLDAFVAATIELAPSSGV